MVRLKGRNPATTDLAENVGAVKQWSLVVQIGVYGN